MAESQARSIFGIHDVTFYNRTTWLPMLHYRVLGDVTIEMPSEFAELRGGSNLFVFDSAVSSFKPTMTIMAREMSGDILETSVSATVTEYSADTDGDIISEANVNGTSVYDAAEGIASITVADADELKEGWYVAKATSASAVDIYALSSSGFGRGTDESFIDDALKITSAAITVPASGASAAVTNFGIKLLGGSSAAIAMTTDDTMRFYVQKPHGGAYSAAIGAQPMVFPEYGCVISSEDNSGQQYNMLLYRVKPAGMAFPFKEKGYGEFNLSTSIMYDSTFNGIGVFKSSSPE